MHRLARFQLQRLTRKASVRQACAFSTGVSHRRPGNAAGAPTTVGVQPPAPKPLHPRSTTQAAVTMSEQLRSIITPVVIRDVQDFWFEHIPDRHELSVPGAATHQRWYFGGEAVDKICVAKFGTTLQALKEANVASGQDVLNAVRPEKPSDWLGLLLLLDQMPRNCYRGASSAVVFDYFDKLAVAVAQAAVKAGIPERSPEIRWQSAYRCFFYLPLQHSEDRLIHDEAIRQCRLMGEDLNSLAAQPEAPSAEEDDGFKLQAWQAVHKDVEAAKALAVNQMNFQTRHTALIDKFGRYPHRNEALGRENTAAETEHFASGGDVFGGK